MVLVYRLQRDFHRILHFEGLTRLFIICNFFFINTIAQEYFSLDFCYADICYAVFVADSSSL